MRPSVGRIVLTPVDPATNNGSDIAPAVITRVWCDTCVNIRVLHDSKSLTRKTSVKLFEIEDDALAQGDLHVAYWPPRV